MEASIPSPSADLLLRHGRFVRSLARDLLRDEHLAEDVVQDTWLRFIERSPREGRLTRSWLGSVVRHLAIDRLRSRARSRTREEAEAPVEPQSSADEALEHAELLRSVVEAVLALEEPYRSTVLMRYWRGWNARRIASETRAPVATVRSRLQRAHEKLRERLDRERGAKAWALALGALAGRSGVETAALAIGTGAKLALGGLAAVGLAVLLWRTLASPSRTPANPMSVGPTLAVPLRQERASEAATPTAQAGRSEVGSVSKAGWIRASGRVIDRAYPELGLIEGPAARLRLHMTPARNDFGFPSLGRAETVTDDAGRFEVELADPGERPLCILLTAEGGELYRSGKHVARAGEALDDLLILRAAHGVLHGTVVDDEGEALEGVALRFHDQQSKAIREVSSGPDGTFAVATVSWIQKVEASFLRYSLLAWDQPEQLAEGGWKPTIVRMARSAGLQVVVRDPQAQPIAGVRIGVQLDDSEESVLGLKENSFFEERGRWGTTDPLGTIVFSDLWAGRKLIVNVDRDTACSVHEGRLLFEDEPRQGVPIVLMPGESRELEARLQRFRLAGRVMFPDGSPVPSAKLHLFDLERNPDQSFLDFEADERGVFSRDYYGPERRGLLSVSASDVETRREQSSGLGYVGNTAHPTSERHSTEMTIDPLADPELLGALELVLQPTDSIEGVLHDPPDMRRDALIGSGVWAVPVDSHPARNKRWEGEVDDQGRFAIRGLHEGLYDVFVAEETWSTFYSYENFVHRFPSVPAGTRGLEVRFPERQEVRIRVRLHGGEPSGFTILKAKFLPADPDSFGAQAAERKITVSGPSGWPEQSIYGFAGIGGGRVAGGSWLDGYDGIVGEQECELPPLGAGWYSIGVHPHGTEAQDWFPQATPLLRFEPGSYTIDFELLPAATVRGRIFGDLRTEFLAVALVGEDSGPISVGLRSGFSNIARIVDASASGEFVMHEVPVGRFRLRAGTRAELEDGLFRREIQLEIQPGENPFVRIQF